MIIRGHAKALVFWVLFLVVTIYHMLFAYRCFDGSSHILSSRFPSDSDLQPTSSDVLVPCPLRLHYGLRLLIHGEVWQESPSSMEETAEDTTLTFINT